MGTTMARIPGACFFRAAPFELAATFLAIVTTSASVLIKLLHPGLLAQSPAAKTFFPGKREDST